MGSKTKPRATAKSSRSIAIDSLLKKLKGFGSRSRSLHFDISKTVHELMNHGEFSIKPREWKEDFNDTVTNLLPGMTPLTLSNMYRYFPDKETWEEMRLEGVYKAAVDKYADEKPKPPRVPRKQDAARVGGNDDAKSETDEDGKALADYACQSEGIAVASPRMFDNEGRPLDILGRPNPGGKDFAGKTLDKWAAMEVEIEMLKEDVIRKDAEIERLKEENKQLRIKVSEYVVRN